MTRQVIKRDSEKLAFGKWKDRTVKFVLENDPQYILWLDKEEIVEFDNEEIVHYAGRLYNSTDRYGDSWGWDGDVQD